MRDANEEELNKEMEQNSEMEQNNEITGDVEERQVDEERPHVGQVHESHESREVEETQTHVKVNDDGSRASERNEIQRRQAKRVVEPSNTTRQIVRQVGKKRKGSPDVQLLGGKRKDPDGRNEQNDVVDKKNCSERCYCKAGH
jgi:carbamoylphosphate synthase small subunit